MYFEFGARSAGQHFLGRGVIICCQAKKQAAGQCYRLMNRVWILETSVYSYNCCFVLQQCTAVVLYCCWTMVYDT